MNALAQIIAPEADVAWSRRKNAYAAGFRPIPVHNAVMGDDKSGKAPSGKAWELEALRDPPRCVAEPPRPHALNTGILCAGLRAIDIDVDDPDNAARCKAVALDMFGETIIRMRQNSGRVLLLYRAASGEPRKRVMTGRDHDPHGIGVKVEILGAGQQFVAFGRHWTGADLQWFPETPGDIERDDLPPITEDAITAFLTAIAPFLDAEPPGAVNSQDHHAAAEAQASPLRIAEAVATIPNTGPADWEAWNRMGMALWHSTGGSALGGELWNEWSKRHPAYDQGETEERWRHYRRSPPTSIGAGTLFHMARLAAHPSETTLPPPPDWDDPPPPESEGDYGEVIQGPWVEHEAREPSHEAKRENLTRFKRLTPAALMALPERGYLLKGIMAPSEMSVWWGTPKGGKSFLLMHVAYALSQGRKVLGRRVKMTRVLYLACEGRSGLRGRIEALVSKHGDSPDFEAIAEPLNLRESGDTDALVEIINLGRFDLVVVDTLNRVMAGGDENNSADMGAVIRNLDHIRANTGAHVAVIHHGTKSGTGGPRGHGSLIGAADAIVEITTAEGGTRTATVTDAKDDPNNQAASFNLEVVDLGQDADGDPRTTCRVDEIAGMTTAGKRTQKLTERQIGWKRDILDMFAAPDKPVERVPITGMKKTLTLTREEVRDGFHVRGRFTADPHAPLTAADRHRFSETLNTLKNKGIIGMTDSLVWLT